MSTALLHLGLDPAAAQALPRWHTDQAGDAAGSSLLVEARMPEAVVNGLRARGHQVERGPDRPQGWGPVSVIALAADGGRSAAADPRVTAATAQGA